MRIVIDLQGAQAESRFRGIGRYSLSLTKAIASNRGEHEIIIVLNGLFPDTIEPIRAEFSNLLPQENIRIWQAPWPVSGHGDDWKRRVVERIRDAFILSLQPDVILISSLFEPIYDNVVLTIGDKIPTAVILYDLIPYMDQEHYLADPAHKKHYLRQIEYLKRAHLCLAISEYTTKEAADALNLDRKRLINISAACDPAFKKTNISANEKDQLFEKLGIRKDFIMYTGGDDDRKNLYLLLKAFAKLPNSIHKDHQMVLVGKIPDGYSVSEKTGLKRDEVLFTGYIADDDLIKLYNLCALFVFPPLCEGFGLPALEAMSCGAAVIGSNATSIPEVIGEQDALFDPKDIHSISSKMKEVLTSNALRNRLKEHGLNQSGKFSWNKSAKIATEALESLHAEGRKGIASAGIQHKKLKLAYFSPIPPEKSEISSYSAELLPYLSKFYDIDVISKQKKAGNMFIKEDLPIRDAAYFRLHSDEYDRLLYHFGNSPFHSHMFDLLREFPGVVTLHDFYLSSLIYYMQHNEYTGNFFSEELYMSHGYSALKYLYDFGHEKTINKYPCSLSVIQHATGLIVHSEFSRKLSVKWFGDETKKWTIIQQLRAQAADTDKNAAKRTLKLKDEDFMICSFGMIGPKKLTHRILDAFAASPLSKEKNCETCLCWRKPR